MDTDFCRKRAQKAVEGREQETEFSTAKALGFQASPLSMGKILAELRNGLLNGLVHVNVGSFRVV
jgi:hypothetical protein